MASEAKNDDKGGGPDRDRHFKIKIDRDTYEVDKERMTGREIRLVPALPIGEDRDLFEVVPGGSDRKIENDTVVEIKNGLRFFTAPRQINPGGDPFEEAGDVAAAR